MKAVIYSRVSTDEQKKHGISLEAQVSRCEQYADSLDLLVIHTGVEGQSGKDTDRPELQSILSLANRKQFQHLLIVKLDRLSRETEDALRVAKALSKKGIKIHLVTEGGEVDFSDPSAEMMFTMRAGFATYERKRIAMNTKFALARKKEKNERVSGEAPYGYRFQDGKVVEDSNEQYVINRVKDLQAQGYSQRKIIAQLTTEGITNRKGNVFQLRSIQLILKAA